MEMLPGGPHLGYDDHGAQRKKCGASQLRWNLMKKDTLQIQGQCMAFTWRFFAGFNHLTFLIGDTILHGGFVICVIC